MESPNQIIDEIDFPQEYQGIPPLESTRIDEHIKRKGMIMVKKFLIW